MCTALRSSSFAVCATLAAAAACQSLEQWIAWGDAAMARGEHYGASRFYDGALAMDGGRLSLQWKMAEACRLSHQYGRAAELYARVHAKDQGRTHREALHRLGEMQLCDGRYDDAAETWRRVHDKVQHTDPALAQRARNALAGIAMAKAAAQDTIRIEHLPPPVNTFDSEFGSRIGPDGSLYFSSLRGELNEHGEVIDTAAYRTMILRSKPQGRGWSAPERLPDAINGTGHNGNATWTPDGRHFLFTRCERGLPCRIFIAPVVGEGFGESMPLPGLGDSLHATQPMVVEWDRRTMLLFASDRPGGLGGTDLWQARLVDGRAVEVAHLGRAVNTPGNERCPWFDPGTNTLWYSSDFLPGLGGHDIFRATFSDDHFGPPVNAGKPFNSPADDLYPAILRDRREAWLTSNRVGSLAAKGETCCNDLYRLPLPGEPTVPVSAADEGTHEPGETPALAPKDALRLLLPLKLYFHNDEPEPRTRLTTTRQDYANTFHAYRARVPEYFAAGAGEDFRIFFAHEAERGFRELDALTEALRAVLAEGTSITLGVRGHASPLAKNDYNHDLSLRRISSLENHLRRAHGGVLAPYLDGNAANGARLTLQRMPYGEERALPWVSDGLDDLRNSVYSAPAAYERRIEVEWLDAGHEGAAIEERQEHDLGRLRAGEERTVRFTIENKGDRPMRLLDAKADCGCTTAELPANDLQPGEGATVEVHFNGRAPEGALRRTVVVRTNGLPERVSLVLTGTIVP